MALEGGLTGAGRSSKPLLLHFLSSGDGRAVALAVFGEVGVDLGAVGRALGLDPATLHLNGHFLSRGPDLASAVTWDSLLAFFSARGFAVGHSDRDPIAVQGKPSSTDPEMATARVDRERLARDQKRKPIDGLAPTASKKQAVVRSSAPAPTLALPVQECSKSGISGKGKGLAELHGDEARGIFRPDWAVREGDSVFGEARVAREIAQKAILPVDESQLKGLSVKSLSSAALQSAVVALNYMVMMERAVVGQVEAAQSQTAELEAALLAKSKAEANLKTIITQVAEVTKANSILRCRNSNLRRWNAELKAELKDVETRAVEAYKSSAGFIDEVDEKGSLYFVEGFQYCLELLAAEFPDLDFSSVAALKPSPLVDELEETEAELGSEGSAADWAAETEPEVGQATLEDEGGDQSQVIVVDPTLPLVEFHPEGEVRAEPSPPVQKIGYPIIGTSPA